MLIEKQKVLASEKIVGYKWERRDGQGFRDLVTRSLKMSLMDKEADM